MVFIIPSGIKILVRKEYSFELKKNPIGFIIWIKLITAPLFQPGLIFWSNNVQNEQSKNRKSTSFGTCDIHKKVKAWSSHHVTDV